MLSDIFLRLLLANVLRPRQKPSPKERAGAGVNRTPLLQVTTAHAIEVDLERAQEHSQASPTASGGGSTQKELLKAARIVQGGHDVDKRNLPAEQGKGVSCQQNGRICYATLERLPRDKGGSGEGSPCAELVPCHRVLVPSPGQP